MPKAATWIFRTICALALLYVLWAIWVQWERVSAWSPKPTEFAIVAVACLSQCAILLLLAEIWHRLVSAVSTNTLTRIDTYGPYCLTQIGKYLPGNVFHVIGRHVVLTKKGVEQQSLVIALTMEVGILLLAALLVTALAGITVDVLAIQIHLRGFEYRTILSYLALAALAVATVGLVIVIRSNILPARLLNQGLIGLSLAACFFVANGLLFWVLSQTVSPVLTVIALSVVPLSWIAGYITPGAPGGLGVREASLLLFLTSVIAEADALILIGLFRLVAVCGDLFLFIVGQIFFSPRAIDPAQRK